MKPIREIFKLWGVLDSEGRHINGTDKETNHKYGDAYDQIISCNFYNPAYISSYEEVWNTANSELKLKMSYLARDSVKLMMEVGIADGSSLCAWREIFHDALCVGLDIHHSDKAHGDRIEFHRGDATNLEDCRRAAGGRKFDLIVEDTTHKLEDSLLTLLYLWPYVAHGGLYVIEEFANIGHLRDNITALWPNARIIDTVGPFGGIEPLVVLRKP